jgi:hypothetical protein
MHLPNCARQFGTGRVSCHKNDDPHDMISTMHATPVEVGEGRRRQAARRQGVKATHLPKCGPLTGQLFFVEMGFANQTCIRHSVRRCKELPQHFRPYSASPTAVLAPVTLDSAAHRA